jgi:hypothetical protein
MTEDDLKAVDRRALDRSGRILEIISQQSRFNVEIIALLHGLQLTGSVDGGALRSVGDTVETILNITGELANELIAEKSGGS